MMKDKESLLGKLGESKNKELKYSDKDQLGLDLGEFKVSKTKARPNKTNIAIDIEIVEGFKNFVKEQGLNLSHGQLINKILAKYLENQREC